MTTETQEESEIDTKQPREDQNGIFLGHTIFAAVPSAYVEKIRARLVDYYYLLHISIHSIDAYPLL